MNHKKNIIITIIAILSLLTLKPFINLILWSGFIAVALNPITNQIEKKIKYRFLSASLVSLGILIALCLPLIIAFNTAINQAQTGIYLLKTLENTNSIIPKVIAQSGHLQPLLEKIWMHYGSNNMNMSLEIFFKTHATEVMKKMTELASKTITITIKSLIIVALSGIFLWKKEELKKMIQKIGFLIFQDENQEFLHIIESATIGVGSGVVGTALILSIIVAIGLKLLGIPNAALIWIITFFLCLIQIGPSPILLLSLAYLFWTNHHLAVIGLIVLFGFVTILDSFLRPYLIGKSLKMPISIIFVSIVGGLISFGLLGLFIGPISLALLLYLYEKNKNKE
jgi:predicted PurR-regulated permease PerM